MLSRIFFLIPFAAVLADNARAAQEAGTKPTPPTAARITLPRQQPPVGAIAPPPRKSACRISFHVKEEKTPDGIWLTAVATNLSKKPIVLSAADRCPAGPIRWTGLPDDYDYYQGCTKGACAGPRPRVKWTLAPGRTEELGGIVVRPKGGTCAAPLPPGTHTVMFLPPDGAPTGDALCGPVGTTIVVAGRVRRVPSTPAPKCPPLKACAIVCDGPPARDKNGCPTCGCEDAPATTTIQTKPRGR